MSLPICTVICFHEMYFSLQGPKVLVKLSIGSALWWDPKAPARTYAQSERCFIAELAYGQRWATERSLTSPAAARWPLSPAFLPTALPVALDAQLLVVAHYPDLKLSLWAIHATQHCSSFPLIRTQVPWNKNSDRYLHSLLPIFVSSFTFSNFSNISCLLSLMPFPTGCLPTPASFRFCTRLDLFISPHVFLLSYPVRP